jgi:hypothetical protein
MSPEAGTQAQRTTLSWTRTGIAAGVLAAVLLRGAIATGPGIALAAAVVGAVGAVAILGLGSRMARRQRRVPGPHRTCDYRGTQVVTVVVVVIGFLTLGLVVTG